MDVEEVVEVGAVATGVDCYIMTHQVMKYKVEIGLDLNNNHELNHKMMIHSINMAVWIHMTFLKEVNKMTFPWKLSYFQ